MVKCIFILGMKTDSVLAPSFEACGKVTLFFFFFFCDVILRYVVTWHAHVATRTLPTRDVDQVCTAHKSHCWCAVAVDSIPCGAFMKLFFFVSFWNKFFRIMIFLHIFPRSMY